MNYPQILEDAILGEVMAKAELLKSSVSAHRQLEAHLARIVPVASMNEEMTRVPLPPQYLWQFEILTSRGWAVPAGWNGIVLNLVKHIDQFLTHPIDRRVFRWIHIREDEGRLATRWGCGACVTANAEDMETIVRLAPDRAMMTADGRCALYVDEDVVGDILLAEAEAMRLCAETCEICGEPGYALSEAWCSVRCAAHQKTVVS